MVNVVIGWSGLSHSQTNQGIALMMFMVTGQTGKTTEREEYNPSLENTKIHKVTTSN